MITSNDVLRVARTGQALHHNGGTLTVETIVRLTGPDDWFGTLYQLKTVPAQQFATAFNKRWPDAAPTFSQDAGKGITPPVAARPVARRLELVAAS